MRKIALTLAATSLASCGLYQQPADCTRIRTGEVLHGEAKFVGSDSYPTSYIMRDRNGMEGRIDGENSDGFICHLTGPKTKRAF